MRWKKWAIGFGLVPVGLWVLACGALFVGQRALLYPRPSPRQVEASRLEFVKAEAAGVEVPVAWYGEGPATVVWFHGNGEQLADTEYIVPTFLEAGHTLAAIEHAGYGLSRGPGPDEASILAGARAGMERIGGKPACVGWSLGSGVAARMANEGRCSALVLLSPYTSIANVAADQYPIFPVRTLILDRFETDSFADAILVPTLIVHGNRDRLIPIKHGKALSEQIPGAVFREAAGGHLIGADPAILAVVATWLAETEKSAQE